MSAFKIYLVAVVAALGGFVFGFDTGMIATTLGHDSFKLYFYGPAMFNPSYTGQCYCIPGIYIMIIRLTKALAV